MGGGAIDWEVAYDNRRAVPGAEALHVTWAERAAEFRAATAPERLSYGAHARQGVDLFRPEGAPVGLAVFVHGGYWMRNGPEVFSHLATGALAHGWAVAMPGYRLAPEVGIADITTDVSAAMVVAAAAVGGPIRLAGHSAGGHLAARMLCTGVLDPAVLARVPQLLSISGIHDLRPLMRTPMNEGLKLDLAQARAESPALAEPAAAVPLTAWVGADELPELCRQSALLANVWRGFGLETTLVEDAGHEHFSVIEALADSDSPITRAWIG